MMDPSGGVKPGSALFRLDGRVAFVSGAAGYLGRSISWGLAEAGARVVLNGRDKAKLTQLQDELTEAGYSALVAAFDVTDPQRVKDYFERDHVRVGRLDVLVNNAYRGEAGTLETATPEAFDAAQSIVVTAAFHCIRCAEPFLEQAVRETGHASVVNIASMYGVVSPDPRIYENTKFTSPPYYGAAKAALIQLTRYAACSLAPKGIRVNAVSPGPFPSPAVCEQAPEFVRRLCEKTPLGRVGSADELRGALLFLASDASTYVTGVNLAVDGGWTAW